MSNSDYLSYNSETGWIACVMCSGGGPAVLDCAHVLGAFYDNTDLADLWDHFPIEVQIPIASKRGVWATVEIDGFAAGLPGQAIVLWNGEAVCVIGKSEGRAVIRSALLAQMYGDFNFNESCAASTHGLVEERIWTREVRQAESNSPDRVAQLWTVYATNVCIACNKKIESALGETPERQGNNVWNNS